MMPAAARHAWVPQAARPAWLAAAAGLVVLCALFHQEVAAAMKVWNDSTAYGHCWLVLPIVGWLLWERRPLLAGAVRPTAWPAVAAIPVLLVWIIADWLGVMEGRQLALVTFAELLLIACLGWRLWWSLSPAFLYLLFLVPFGAFLTPTLQRFTTGFILSGLGVLDIPFQADAFRITIPEGGFYVAEACAGLRFLIASIAFGVLYAVTIFRSPWRRAAFIAVACIVPVLANGVRGLGIVLLGHLLGSAEAGAADHLIYGWVFFSFVIVLLALSGLPFRQDTPLPAAPPGHQAATPARRLAFAGASVLLLAAAGPFSLALLDARSPASLAVLTPKLTLPATCHAEGSRTDGATSTQTVRCGQATLRVIATTLPSAANPSRILAAGRDPALAPLTGEADSEAWRTPAGAPWMLLTVKETGEQSAYAVWVDGHPMIGGLRDRVAMARDMLATNAPPQWPSRLRCRPSNRMAARACGCFWRRKAGATGWFSEAAAFGRENIACTDALGWLGAWRRQARPSFLQKRSKKLLTPLSRSHPPSSLLA